MQSIKINANNASNNKSNKPFCKVCFDAGKNEIEYTSHYVKSKPGSDGVVVCPTLLMLNCRYCHQAGHTVSKCIVLQSNKKNEEKNKRREMFKTTHLASNNEKNNKNNNMKNTFSHLIDDSDDEEQDERNKSSINYEEFPSLCNSKNINVSQNTISYADVASKQKVEPKTPELTTEVVEWMSASKNISINPKVQEPTVEKKHVFIPSARILNWAMSDSDSDSDCDQDDSKPETDYFEQKQEPAVNKTTNNVKQYVGVYGANTALARRTCADEDW